MQGGWKTEEFRLFHEQCRLWYYERRQTRNIRLPYRRSIYEQIRVAEDFEAGYCVRKSNEQGKEKLN